jgi:hypothetical protein
MQPTISLRSALSIIGALTVAASSGAAAQQPPNSTPLLQIGVEAVRGGRGAAHMQLEQDWSRAYCKADLKSYWIGTTTVTGPDEYWWFTPLESFAQFEAQNKAISASPDIEAVRGLLSKADAENVSESRNFIVRYRADLSRPGGTPVPQARYVQMITMRVRPGRQSTFEDAAKLYAQVVGEAKAEGHWVVYQGASGISEDTFMIFIALKSLAELDPGPDEVAINKAMTPARQKQMNDLSAAGFISTTSTLLQMQPRMSYVPADMAAVDPTFWNVKP